ncbi:hypothetical protein [Thermococcus paralvinellae]|uniref:Uncharacterized protein n=1 Tax=Thermococcus paralvinellae TaxID=582419 RepID=W0I5W5_9EURY|nr:hypothetical protein [Thermococcus paralvinellae]AHF79845.1 Hypothetical protein TES1_0451 [Thermococcus paralvinellae]
MTEIGVIFYIEGLGNDRKALERAIEQVVKELKEENTIKVKRVKAEDIIESNSEDELLKYSAMIEAELEGSFNEIIKATLKYSPVIVEVLKPGKLEINAKELMRTLGDVALFMGKLMDQFGGLAAYPPLDKLPKPRIGYSDEEIEEFIVDERNVRYQFVIETYGKDKETIEETIMKAFYLEGCKINKFVVQVQEEKEDKVYALVAAELLSSFETLMQLTAKYAPVAISILEPEIIDVTASELQNVLTDLAGFVNELVHRPLKKKLVEQDTIKFSLS